MSIWIQKRVTLDIVKLSTDLLLRGALINFRDFFIISAVSHTILDAKLLKVLYRLPRFLQYLGFSCWITRWEIIPWWRILLTLEEGLLILMIEYLLKLIDLFEVVFVQLDLLMLLVLYILLSCCCCFKDIPHLFGFVYQLNAWLFLVQLMDGGVIAILAGFALIFLLGVDVLVYDSLCGLRNYRIHLIDEYIHFLDCSVLAFLYCLGKFTSVLVAFGFRYWSEINLRDSTEIDVIFLFLRVKFKTFSLWRMNCQCLQEVLNDAELLMIILLLRRHGFICISLFHPINLNGSLLFIQLAKELFAHLCHFILLSILSFLLELLDPVEFKVLLLRCMSR